MLIRLTPFNSRRNLLFTNPCFQKAFFGQGQEWYYVLSVVWRTANFCYEIRTAFENFLAGIITALTGAKADLTFRTTHLRETDSEGLIRWDGIAAFQGRTS